MAATTARMTPRQKRRLEMAVKALEQRLGRRLTQGEAIAVLADAALRRPDLLDMAEDSLDLDLSDDPFFNGSLRFRMGKTDARTIDAILYGEGR